MIKVLNNNVKIVQLTSFSKRWWNEDVKEARRNFGRAARYIRR